MEDETTDQACERIMALVDAYVSALNEATDLDGSWYRGEPGTTVVPARDALEAAVRGVADNRPYPTKEAQ
jgi:hypothetical protein